MRLHVATVWLSVTSLEFEELIQRYPRKPLRIEPPLNVERAVYRRYIDDSLGKHPDNEVATWNVSRSTPRIMVRTDIEGWPICLRDGEGV